MNNKLPNAIIFMSLMGIIISIYMIYIGYSKSSVNLQCENENKDKNIDDKMVCCTPYDIISIICRPTLSTNCNDPINANLIFSFNINFGYELTYLPYITVDDIFEQDISTVIDYDETSYERLYCYNTDGDLLRLPIESKSDKIVLKYFGIIFLLLCSAALSSIIYITYIRNPHPYIKCSSSTRISSYANV